MTRRKVLLGIAVVVVWAGFGFSAGISHAEGHWSPEMFLALGVSVVGLLALNVINRDRVRDAPDVGYVLFGREVARARRQEEPLVLLRLDLARAERPGESVHRGPDDLLSWVVRTTDVVWEDGDDVFVAMPNATRSTAAECVSRLYAAGLLAANATVSVAVFPEDAVTESALLEAVRAPVATVAVADLLPGRSEQSSQPVERDTTRLTA